MLTPAQLKAREGKLTASRVACLMTGDAAAIMALWREMIGDPGAVEEDLSNVWAVQLGIATESLNLSWFERKHGDVRRRGEVVTGSPSWMAATLDGWSEKHQCPVEAKHCGGFEKFEIVRARYMPQMQWQMLVTGAPKCALSVILGANEPVVEMVPLDVAYATELQARANTFMNCVWSFTEPLALPAVEPPAKVEKAYDMTGKNEWANFAVGWLQTHDAAKLAVAAEKKLKSLVPADAARCYGHGVEITRNRAGHLSLKESCP